MPVDYYPQKTQKELLSLLQSLQTRQIAGGVSMVQGPGLLTKREFQQAGTSRVEVEIRRVLYSLHIKDPDNYDDPYASMLKRTRARYTFS